jgi:alkylresorcinol/alkylpyrone synthase
VYTQAEITDRFAAYCLGDGPENADKHAFVRRLHSSAGVSTRHLALPIEAYLDLDGFGAHNDAYIDAAIDLGAEAITGALDDVGLRAEDVDYIISTTVTGIAVPSLEARIASVIGLRPGVRRIPMFGLGCVAGASGLARLHDVLRGDPQSVGVLLSVELCSLTVQRDDPSTANLVASGLFGDGAAAVVAVGDERPEAGPRIVDSSAHLYPDTLRAMGWDVGATGLKIVLDAEVPDLVTAYLGEDVRQFLKSHDLEISDVAAWVAHPGGPKVLEAMQVVLGLTDGELALTWESLNRIGNLSSASVLHVLRDTLDRRDPPSGSPGLLLAMGPGFCAELVLLRW